MKIKRVVILIGGMRSGKTFFLSDLLKDKKVLVYNAASQQQYYTVK